MIARRELTRRMTRLTVVSVLAAGAWAVGVRWLHARRDAAKLELDRSTLELASERSHDSRQAAEYRQIAERLSAREESLAAGSERSAEKLKIYESIGLTARQYRLKVDQVQPLRTARADARAGKPGAPPVQTTAAYSFEVTGAFADVCDFVASLERELGLTFVTTLRLEPIASADRHSQLVRAEVETVHLRVTPMAPAYDPPKAGTP